jgi:hypothetical protein
MLNFLQALYEHSEGRLELRAFLGGKPSGRAFVELDKLPRVERFAFEHSRENVFFGVGTRDKSGEGRKQNVMYVPALWADVDFKDTTPSATKTALDSFPFHPSAAVLSGHGVHFYWILREPATPAELPDIEDRLRRICAHFKADPSTCEIARVMRLPGSLNVKSEPAKEVKLHFLNGFRNDLEDFAELPEPKCTPSGKHSTEGRNPPGWMVEAFKGIPEGGNEHFAGRDVAGVKIAGYFVDRLKEHELAYLLACWNVRNNPPLPESDLTRIIGSVKRYEKEPQRERASVSFISPEKNAA